MASDNDGAFAEAVADAGGVSQRSDGDSGGDGTATDDTATDGTDGAFADAVAETDGVRRRTDEDTTTGGSVDQPADTTDSTTDQGGDQPSTDGAFADAVEEAGGVGQPSMQTGDAFADAVEETDGIQQRADDPQGESGAFVDAKPVDSFSGGVAAADGIERRPDQPTGTSGVLDTGQSGSRIDAFLQRVENQDAEVDVDNPLGGAPRLSADEGIAASLTGGGVLFAEGTESVDQPGELDAPQQVDPNTPTEDVEVQIAIRNEGIDRDDVEVERTDDGLDISLTEAGVRGRVAAANPGVEADDVVFTDDGPARETEGFDPLSGDLVPTRRELQQASQSFQEGVGTYADLAGTSVDVLATPQQSALELVGGDLGGALDEVSEPASGVFGRGLEAAEERDDTIPTLAEGAAQGAGAVVDIPALALTADTAAGAASGAVREGVENPGATAETAAVLAGESTVEGGKAAAEAAEEAPVRTTGLVAGGIATGYLSGAVAGTAAKRAFIGARGRLATRGLDIQKEVPIENIERPDVRSGESGGLTRLSEQAAPEGGLSIPKERFPSTPADTPVKEVQNLARDFDDPRIRSALGVEEDEVTLFRAVGGRKDSVYEPRSRRPYDPDATFLAPSVARNFLDLNNVNTRMGGVPRRPRPIAATKSLIQAARGKGTPNIIATAGEVEELPADVTSLADRTRFLQEQRNTGTFYAPSRQAQQTVTGESEVFVSAEGATSTEAMTFRGVRYDPRFIEGTGEVPSGETTRFVEVAKPLSTEIRGETVPIQLFRQDTDDVTPMQPEQPGGLRGQFQSFLADERAEVKLGNRPTRGGSRTASTDTPTTPYRPGGQPGTPFTPVVSPPTIGGRNRIQTQGSERDTTEATDRILSGGSRLSRSELTRGRDTDTSRSPTGPFTDSRARPSGTSGTGRGGGSGSGSDFTDFSGGTGGGSSTTTEAGGGSDGGTNTPPGDDSTSTGDPSTSTTPILDENIPTGGESTTTTTIVQERATTNRTPLPDIDLDAEQEELEPVFGGARKGVFTDFLNPLTGEEVETQRDEIDPFPDEPVFLGFEEDSD